MDAPVRATDGGAAVGAAILVDTCLAAYVLAARSSSPHPLIPAEMLGSLAIAVAYGTPAIVAAIALRERPSLFVAAALLAGALSFTAFSLVTLVLVPPAVLFLGAAAGTRRSRRAALIGAIVVLPAIVASLAVGAFAAVWLLPVGLAGAGIALLARHARAAGRGLVAARIVAGIVAVVGLAAAAWLLPIVDTAAICWSSQGGSFTQTAAPEAQGGGEQVRVESGGSRGSVGPGGSAGCDGGVPATAASALSLLLTSASALAAISIVPRASAGPVG